MSDIAELEEKIRIAKILIDEAVYAADLDIVRKRRENLASLEAQLAEVKPPEAAALAEENPKEGSSPFFAALAAATTEEQVEEIILRAGAKVAQAESLEHAGKIMQEVLGPDKFEEFVGSIDDLREFLGEESWPEFSRSAISSGVAMAKGTAANAEGGDLENPDPTAA